MTASEQRFWERYVLPLRVASVNDRLNRLMPLPDGMRFEYLGIEDGPVGRLQVVVGGQYGSEGKGAVASYLAAEHQRGMSIRVAGPNAGHTVLGRCHPDCASLQPAEMLADFKGEVHPSHQHPWRLQQVPVAAVSSPDESLVIAQGSEIEPDLLMRECDQLDKAGYNASERLIVDRQATIIEPIHVVRENPAGLPGLTERIGSTGKGVGAARAARTMRDARLARDHNWIGARFTVTDTMMHIRSYIDGQRAVLVEGTQGYGLGIHAGQYPQCTSSDCTAIDMLSMAGISPWTSGARLEVWVVFRAYPIRVAGNSGPLMDETTWEELGLPQELTTVTRKVRRVGHWEAPLAREAILANGGPRYGDPAASPVRAALTMADHAVPMAAGATSLDHLSGETRDRFTQLVTRTEYDLGCSIGIVGTGPSSFIDLRHQ
jgi:adenylosuccinate synthase